MGALEVAESAEDQDLNLTTAGLGVQLHLDVGMLEGERRWGQEQHWRRCWAHFGGAEALP